tara:strand:- start:110 stop:370 length:261 start_codon:yes stop_codon:yes gene_type:complete
MSVVIQIIKINKNSNKFLSLIKYTAKKDDNKKNIPKTLFSIFLVILSHSEQAIENKIIKNKIKKADPLIIKKSEKGIIISELSILF